MRIYLRALEPDDYKTSIKWRKDDDIWSSLIGPKYFVSSEYERQWVLNSIQDRDNLKLAICLKENDEYIGNAYLFKIDHFNKNASSGKMIGVKNQWGHGYATEATLLILRHAFMVLGLQRVSSRVLSNNERSISVLLKCGYKREGLMRKAIYKNGDFLDLVIMGVTRSDFDDLEKDYKWE